MNTRDGTNRCVIDYRKLNAVTKKDVYSPGNIDDALDLLGPNCGLVYMIRVADTTKFPFQRNRNSATIRLLSDERLNFSVPSFGLCCAPATFQRAVYKVFSELKWECMFPYLDDILVFSDTFEEHLDNTGQVFLRARQHGSQFKTRRQTRLGRLYVTWNL